MPQPAWARALAFGDRLTPALKRDLAKLFAETRERIPVSALVTLIEHHGLTPSEVARVLEQFPARLAAAAGPAIRQGTTGAADIAAADVADRLRLVGRLDIVNPLAVQYASQQSAQLVTRVTIETRQAIQTIVSVAIQSGIAPRDAARLIRQVIGLNTRQAKALTNYRRRLVDGGTSTSRVETLVERYSAKLLRQRSEMIARTELITSLSSGQQAAWLAAQQKGLLPASARMSWITTEDDRTCPYCLAMDGKTAPIGGWFETPLGPRRGPTLHVACRCALSLSAASLSVSRAA
jgi:hypothetical protein